MTIHTPVLLQPVLEALIEPFRKLTADHPPCALVDCTLGGGGHTAAILEVFGADPGLRKNIVIAIDRDISAIEAARSRFVREIEEKRLFVFHGRFSRTLEFVDNQPVLGFLADIGLSSDQLEDSQRGISFRSDGPLDMRMDNSDGETCADYLANVSEQDLEQVLREFGEERFASRIARAIVSSRDKNGVPGTARELAELIVRAVPAKFRHGRIHAATRSFQALRIFVNKELEELDCMLEHVILSLKSGGRAAFISFHSLEDRKIKQAFRRLGSGQSPLFKLVNKKPLYADSNELESNPRSRSAKLRIIEKL